MPPSRNRLEHAYRRTGADLPGGDPLPSHGTEMEGWFWRATDAATGRVVVVLCGVNRHPAGEWATVAVALHPGDVVRSAVLDDARAARDRFSITAGTDAGARFEAGPDRVSVTLDDVSVDLRTTEPFVWPKRFGGGGIFSSVPYLNQYWHPYRLGGAASGVVRHGDDAWQLDGAALYCERNWGAGFPDRWWWGQAHDFDGEDASLAFSGGLLRLGPVARDVNGVVVRLGRRVIRITPPMPTRSEIGADLWRLRARSPRFSIELEGDGAGRSPHVLPVPLPAERRNVDTDFEHLAGRLHCRIRERGRVIFDATSLLAGLEIGSLPGARPGPGSPGSGSGLQTSRVE